MPDPDRRVDTLGLLCPLPLLLAAREIQSLEPGQVLEILSDDEGIYGDVPAWCERAGHRLLGFEEEGAVITCWVEKGTGEA